MIGFRPKGAIQVRLKMAMPVKEFERNVIEAWSWLFHEVLKVRFAAVHSWAVDAVSLNLACMLVRAYSNLQTTAVFGTRMCTMRALQVVDLQF